MLLLLLLNYLICLNILIFLNCLIQWIDELNLFDFKWFEIKYLLIIFFYFYLIKFDKIIFIVFSCEKKLFLEFSFRKKNSNLKNRITQFFSFLKKCYWITHFRITQKKTIRFFFFSFFEKHIFHNFFVFVIEELQKEKNNPKEK